MSRSREEVGCGGEGRVLLHGNDSGKVRISIERLIFLHFLLVSECPVEFDSNGILGVSALVRHFS